MKNPYMPARRRPTAGLPALFMKNETVIGTIGKTQGVSRAANPQRIASIINAQSEPPPAASSARGRSPPPGFSRLRRCCRICGRWAGGNGYGQLRVVGRHAARVVAEHPFDLRLDGGCRIGELHPLGEAGLAGEGSDLHAEQFVEIAVRRVEAVRRRLRA